MSSIVQFFSTKSFAHIKVLGFIPLDILLHGVIGQIIYILSRKKLPAIGSIILVAIIELVKEIIDFTLYYSDLLECMKDFSATMVLPLLAFAIDKLILNKKTKLN